MSGTPWWFSGGEEPDAPPRARLDLSSFTAGAQQLLELARTTLLAPHAGHADPAEHPECVVCRTSLAVGDLRMARPTAPGAIAWIELDPPQPGAPDGAP